MVVRLVAHGNALVHELTAAFAVDTEAGAVGILLCVVSDDSAQVIEQTSDAGGDGGGDVLVEGALRIWVAIRS